MSHRSHRSHRFCLVYVTQKSQKSRKCCYANTDCTDHTDHTDLIYCPAETAEIAEIIMTDGIFFHLLESSCKRACRIILSIEKSYSLCKMNKSLNFFEELMRASFQYFSNKLKRYSIKVNSFYSSDSCSYKISVENVSVNICDICVTFSLTAKH